MPTFESMNREQNNAAFRIDKDNLRHEDVNVDLQRRLEEMLPACETQYDEFKANKDKQLWAMKNQGLINAINLAKELLAEFKSSQLVQKNAEEALSDQRLQGFDDARILAFCRWIEIKESN